MFERMVRLLGMAVGGLFLCLCCNGVDPEQAERPHGAERHAAGAATERPDIVVVVIDTLRADHLGIYGYHRSTSPNLDALAGRGVWYSRAYSHSGWTLPSFASLLTGELPHEHRVGRAPANQSQFGRLPAGVETLPEELQAAGYATAALVNNTFLAPEFGLQQGFDMYDYRGARNDEHRSSDETVRQALDWIENQSKPIFLLVHFMEPHPFFDPPEEIRGTFSGDANPKTEQAFQEMDYVYWVVGRTTPTPEQLNRVLALYDEEILTADRALGVLVEGLEARRRWDQTLLVVTADHGEEFWDHGRFEHGHDLHGELTRVPLVIAGGDVGQGEVRDLVDHRGLFRWMKKRAGGEDRSPFEQDDAQADGQGASLRFSVSENTLRGQPMASVVNEQYRLLFMMETGVSELWSVDERGRELEPVSDEAELRHKQLLLDLLARVRGDLKPVPVVGPEFPSPEVFDQLRELGYIQ